MKPIKFTPYSKTSYLPDKITYGKSSPVDELLHIIDLQHKEIKRLLLVVAHKSKEVVAFGKEVERLQSIINGQTQALFGRSTEQRQMSTATAEVSSVDEAPLTIPKTRGAKIGHKGYGRKLPDLPAREVYHEIQAEQLCCKDCGKAFNGIALTEDSCELNIEVQYILVKHKRKRAVRACSCSGVKFVTAPKPAQIVPKSMFSHRFLAYVLTQKYFFQIPLYRVLLMMQMRELWVTESSLVGLFKKLHVLLTPLYEKLIEVNKKADHWHADETGWKNFVCSKDKQNFNWWLWIFATKQTVVYVLDPGRSADVPLTHFGEEAKGVISSDRYCSYNKLTRQTEGLTNAFCWVHFRRDFINAGKGYTFLRAWSDIWVSRIGELYHLNKNRLTALEVKKNASTEQEVLAAALETFAQQIDAELASSTLNGLQRKILRSARRNWERYNVFFHHPHIPMDNNTAERLLRPAALGRKNYYGSHATWSGEFAALCMSLFQTAALHHLNVEAYLRYILDELSLHPDGSMDLELLLPWNIPEPIKLAYGMRCKNPKIVEQQHISGG